MGQWRKCFNNGLFGSLVMVGGKKLVFLKSYNCIVFTNVKIFFLHLSFHTLALRLFYTLERLYEEYVLFPLTSYVGLSTFTKFFLQRCSKTRRYLSHISHVSHLFHIHSAPSLSFFFSLPLPFSPFVSPVLQTLHCLTWNWLECINF